MRHLSITLLFLFVFTSLFAQNFFQTDYNKRKRYILLANPTVGNIKTVQYLVNANLFDVRNKKYHFVGVYHKDQKYDFSETRKYINDNGIENFFLQEISGELSENNLYEENTCSEDFRILFDHSIGLFLFGGPDIPPGVYKEENSLSVVTDPHRHYFEVSLVHHFLGGYWNEQHTPFIQERPDYLLTGFCLGMQTLNVGTGGTMIQDIPAEIYDATTPEEVVKLGRKNLHRNYWQKIVEDTLLMGINLHTIRFSDHPFFDRAIGVSKRSEPRIYSSHHQAAEKLGKDLEVTAISPDGKIIEALAHKNYTNVFAVQFHPEVPALYEEMYKRRFHPEDQPMSYHEILGKKSVRFHEKYWRYISNVVRNVRKPKKVKN